MFYYLCSVGLFGGRHIRTGNNVSHSHRRTRRTFMPNIHNKTYYSNILQKNITVECTTNAIRTIDKYGSLDNYIVNNKRRNFKQQTFALSLREQMLKQLQLQQQSSTTSTQQQSSQQSIQQQAINDIESTAQTQPTQSNNTV